MKYLKVIVPMLVLAALLVTAMPAAADDPFGGPIPSKTSGDGSTTWAAIYIGDDGMWTGKIAAGASMWFKADAWANKHEQVWLDDQLPGSTTWSGSSNWSALNYVKGSSPSDPKNLTYTIDGTQNANYIHGFAMRIYDQTNLFPNYYYPAPNAFILTTRACRDGSPAMVACKTHGWGSFNFGQPSHLLWYEGNFPGWIYIRVYNQMLYDGWFTIGTKRDNL